MNPVQCPPDVLLRDWFALFAPEEEVVRYQVEAVQYVDDRGFAEFRQHTVCTREVARYRYADAMLEARGNPR